jgi:hypothetical protein
MAADRTSAAGSETLLEKPHLDPSISEEEVQSELHQILESPGFRGSRRCQDFLKYVIEQMLAGSPHGMKERTIGSEVFGRPPDYDTNADGIVRIKASEVRKRLALYYASHPHHSGILIALPTGSYTPVITRMAGSGDPAPDHTLAESSAVHHALPAIAETAQENWTRWKVTSFVLAIVILAGLSAWWIGNRQSNSVLVQFWRPVLRSSSPILVATDYAPVYLPPPNAAPGPYTQLTDQYVGGGDLIAAVKVSTMLTRLGHPYQLRMGTAVSLDDLLNTPTVLIGYSSTQWTAVTRNFRFFIDDNDLGMIKDQGKATDWYPHNRTADYHTDVDYALISRAFDPETHSMLILISGCTQYGTEGAARLATDPDLMSAALHNAPKGWEDKNLQLVLRVQMIANSPASYKIIASYYW